MGIGGKARHIHSDLGDDDMRGHITDGKRVAEAPGMISSG
jgi:hypothetical protein